jgi:hypothetical protein
VSPGSQGLRPPSDTKPCRFLSETRVVPCGRSRMSKVVAFIMLAALSMLGACCLTIFGGVNEYCESDASQNIKRCYRRPDVDLPLAWFSTAIGECEPLLNAALVLTYFQLSPASLRLSSSTCVIVRHTRCLQRMPVGHDVPGGTLWSLSRYRDPPIETVPNVRKKLRLIAHLHRTDPPPHSLPTPCPLSLCGRER